MSVLANLTLRSGDLEQAALDREWPRVRQGKQHRLGIAVSQKADLFPSVMDRQLSRYRRHCRPRSEAMNGTSCVRSLNADF